MDLLSAQKMLKNNLTTLPAMTVSDALAPSQDEASGFDASEPPVSDAVNVTIDDGEPCRVWNNNVGYQSTCELFLCRRFFFFFLHCRASAKHSRSTTGNMK